MRFDTALADGDLELRPFVADDRDALIAGRDDEFRRFLADASEEPAPVASIWVADRIVGWIDYDLGVDGLLGRSPVAGRRPGFCARRYPDALRVPAGTSLLWTPRPENA